jgi:hypothetical protein
MCRALLRILSLHYLSLFRIFHVNAKANETIWSPGGGRRISDGPHRKIKPRDRSTPQGSAVLGSPQL